MTLSLHILHSNFCDTSIYVYLFLTVEELNSEEDAKHYLNKGLEFCRKMREAMELKFRDETAR